MGSPALVAWQPFQRDQHFAAISSRKLDECRVVLGGVKTMKRLPFNQGNVCKPKPGFLRPTGP